MTRFTEVKYLSRKNLGNYEHDECQITAVIGETDNADEIIAFTKLKVQQALGMTFTKVPVAQPKTEVKTEEVKEEEAPKKAAKKTTKVRKEETAKEAEIVQEDKTYTLEEVKTHLASVWKSKGKQVAVEILKEFGVEKSDNLDPSKYSSVVEECLKCLK